MSRRPPPRSASPFPQPELEALEPRDVPARAFPDFAGPVESASVAGGVVAYGAGAGGGPRVKLIGTAGQTVFDQFVYEPSARGGVHVALADVDQDGRIDLCVGAGPGGGPRVRVFRDTGAGYAPAADYFAFDPTFRGGVYVAGWGPHLCVFAGDGGGPVGTFDGVSRLYGPADSRDTTGWAAEDATGDGVPEVFRLTPAGAEMYAPDGTFVRLAVPKLGGVQYPTPILNATPHPAAPASTAQANLALSAIPTWLQGYLRATGMAVQVYAGSGMTDLPEYADLRGAPTPVLGDGGRTYDQVVAVGPVDLATPAVVRADESSVPNTLHEVGHGLWFRLTPSARAEWADVWRAVGWDDSYERLNETEAFAGSFRRWVTGGAGEPAAVTGFFDTLAARLVPADALRPGP